MSKGKGKLIPRDVWVSIRRTPKNIVGDSRIVKYPEFRWHSIDSETGKKIIRHRSTYRAARRNELRHTKTIARRKERNPSYARRH